MSQTCTSCEGWVQFLEYAKSQTSLSAYHNWLGPIEVADWNGERLILRVPNIFVKEYLLSNFKKESGNFLPPVRTGEPGIEFRHRKAGSKAKAILCSPRTSH